MSIAENIQKIKSSLPSYVTLVVVTKTYPVECIMEVYNCGHRIIGENKVQELLDKYEVLPKDIQWHLIGHLQSNKVKYIAPFISLIHSIDSLKLLQEVNKQAQKNNRIIHCLLQVYIGKEETKFGMDFKEIEHLLHSGRLNELNHVKITGLMGMATNTDDSVQIDKEFQSLNHFFNKYKNLETINIKFETLSMGMSSDYPIAIRKGSTMIRIGSSIFGKKRVKKN